MSAAKPKVAVLVGPTAAGKTAVAVQLALKLGAEIVNADSLQVYRELDIGTAKPSPAERALVPHHLLDLVAPDEHYDAARYLADGRAVVAELGRRGVPPLVVGGTGLYLKALLGGLFPDGGKYPEVRRRLQEELAAQGLEALYRRLARLDPDTAGRLAPGDTYRILRALEVVEGSGTPISILRAGHRFADRPYETLKIGLALPRPELYARIDARVEAMLAQGWLAEVRGLLSRYPSHLKPLQALGYRQLIAHLHGEVSLAEAVARIKTETRRYAKRQLTWFRADPEVRWLHPAETSLLSALLEDFFRT